MGDGRIDRNHLADNLYDQPYGGALGTVFANYDNTSYRPDYVPAYWVLYDLYDSNDLRATSISASGPLVTAFTG